MGTATASSQDVSQQDRDAAETLASEVAADFLLSDAEVEALIEAILTARLTSFDEAYAAAADIMDADYDTAQDPKEDHLPAALVRTQRAAARAAATSIAATYTRDLASQAAQFMQTWLSDHDGKVGAGAEPALRSALSSYTEQRADWKAQQVAGYESGSAAQDGTLAALDDAESGDLLDANGDPIDYTQYFVAVLPSVSSDDFCAEYAGNVYLFDEAPQLDFPAHANCIHYIVCVPYTELADLGDADL